MGILDEAIREHLELKRQHGAADSELKQLEDEAFGPPERPGDETEIGNPFAEAPTEFLAPTEVEGNEAPQAPEERVPQAEVETRLRRESAGIADIQEPPPREPTDREPPLDDDSAEDEEPTDPEAAADGSPVPTGYSTEERRAIAEQPTDLFDVEEEEEANSAGGSAYSVEDEPVEDEIEEPRSAPSGPGRDLEGPGVGAGEEEDDPFNEQRLSDELDRALEAPVGKGDLEEHESAVEAGEEEPEEENDQEELAEEEVGAGIGRVAEPGANEDLTGDEDDVLEDTPDFLENSEDDQLWFEQKPPKDFDFDD